MLHFIKLGGSLITDKNSPLTPRPLVIQRLADEIAAVASAHPERQFLLSHGSGSYGHVVGKRYHTREGVTDARGWRGFAETAHIAAQLNRLVMAALLRAGLPAVSFQPSALVACRDGEIVELYVAPILRALEAGLIPVVYGDVAFDESRGGVIVSTEQVLTALVPHLRPERLTLVGLVDGIYDADPLRFPDAQPIPLFTTAQLPQLASALGGSHGIDVTGGMADKITNIAALFDRHPQLCIHLLSGEMPGRLQDHLLDPDLPFGTTMTAENQPGRF